MNKKMALLSSGAALLGSLLLFDVGHAIQTEKKQDIRYLTLAEIKGTANAPTTQVSSTLTPCTGDGLRMPEAPCPKDNLQGSGRKALDKILYTIAGITATLVATLIAIVLWVLLARRIPLPPFVKGTH